MKPNNPTQQAIENLVNTIAQNLPAYPTRKQGPDFRNPRRERIKATKFNDDPAGTRQMMANLTVEFMYSSQGLDFNNLFMLLPEQIATLESLNLDAQDVEFVQSINFLSRPTRIYNLSNLLKAIETIPPKPSDKSQPDWTGWWMTWAKTKPGMHRGTIKNTTPTEDMLSRVLDAMYEQAIQHWPTYAELSQFISPRKTARLGQIYTMACHITAMATGIQVNYSEIPYRNKSPEQVAEILDGSGIEYERDIGTIGDIAELKALIAPYGIDQISTDETHGTWHSRDVSNSWIIPYNAPTNIDPRLKLVEDNHHEPDTELSNDELKLIRLTEPTSRQSQITNDLMKHLTVSSIARINSMSLNAAMEFLEGTATERPLPEHHPKCPITEQCQTNCGHAQRTDLFPFPLTQDGKFESCRYWQFLSININKPPITRELAAQEEIKKLPSKILKAKKTGTPVPETDLFKESDDQKEGGDKTKPTDEQNRAKATSQELQKAMF